MAGLQVLDTRGFTKPAAFSGVDADWVGWQFTFLSYCGLLHDDYETLMDFSAQQPDPLTMTSFAADKQVVAKQLYHMLVMLCNKGRAVNILMSTERHNGFEAWRRLVHEFEPQLPGRWATMLSALIAPAWSTDALEWREEFQQREVDLSSPMYLGLALA